MTAIEGTTAPGFEPVRAAFVANFERGLEVGAAVSVYRHGRPVVDLWAGTAGPTSANPWRRNTLQVIYSCTKSATAACALLLVQRGELDLDAPVAAYWPEFAAAGKERIPVRWLLSHQAGLPSIDHPMPIPDALAWEPMVAALAVQAPIWPPGTAQGYHSMTYGYLVGEVVRRVSGRSIGTFFTEEIARPHGLDFWIGLPEAEHHRVSHLLNQLNREQMPGSSSPFLRSVLVTTDFMDSNRPEVRRAEIPGAGGISTAHGLARFYAALIGEVDGVRILDEDILSMATVAQADGIDRILGAPIRFALGFMLPSPGASWWAPRAFGHPGHGGSLGYADPDTGVAFAYVMNRLHADMSPDTRADDLIAAVRASL